MVSLAKPAYANPKVFFRQLEAATHPWAGIFGIRFERLLAHFLVLNMVPYLAHSFQWYFVYLSRNFRLRQSLSINTLSIQRPRPSMLIAIPRSRR